MANRILKGLAVAVGQGLAVVFSPGRARVEAPVEPALPVESARAADPAGMPEDLGGEFVDINPLLDRVERLEAGALPDLDPLLDRLERIETGLESMAKRWDDFERRMEENSRELGTLRGRVGDAERRVSESVSSFRRIAEQSRGEILLKVEQDWGARAEDLQSRFAAEVEESRRYAVDIAPIERALAEQSASIKTLSARTAETENHLQRLVSVIEKLCERVQAGGPPTALQRAEGPPPQLIHEEPRLREPRLPFESQLEDALRRDRAAGSRQPPAKRGRFFFGNLVAAGFCLLAWRLVG